MSTGDLGLRRFLIKKILGVRPFEVVSGIPSSFPKHPFSTLAKVLLNKLGFYRVTFA